MSEHKFSLETHLRVYNDKTGDYAEIRPDADGLGLVELNTFDDGGDTKTTGVTFYPEVARLVARALLQVADQIDATSELPKE